MDELAPWNIREQEENRLVNNRKIAAIRPTMRKPFLCLTTNAPAFFPASALFSAAFFVISDALTVFAVPRPAFAAAYSRLIARFCCQWDYGLEEKPPFCCANS